MMELDTIDDFAHIQSYCATNCIYYIVGNLSTMKVRGTMKLSTSYRRNALLKELIQSNVPLSLTQLALKLGVKERMIRYDIADVAQTLASYQVVLQQKPKLGYYVLPEHKALLPLELSGAEDPNHFERKSLECEILFYLMSDEYVSAQRIAEVLFLSPVTVTRIIEGMRGREDIPLTIEAVRFKGYHVHEEGTLLKLLKYRLSDRFLTKRFSSPKAILETFAQSDIDRIDVVLKQCNREMDVWMTPKGYTEIKASWILAIAYASRLEALDETQNVDTTDLIGELSYVRLAARKLGIDHLKQWEDWLLAQMLDAGVVVSTHEIPRQELKKTFNAMLNRLENANAYHKDELFEDILPHLHQMFRRQRLQLDEFENPLIESIQIRFVDEFKDARLMYAYLMEEYGFHDSVHEISYLAMYLVKHRISNPKLNKRAVIVCATGKGFSKLMQARVLARFPNLELVESLSAYQVQEIDLEVCDLVISTVPLQNVRVPVVVVSPILGQEDTQRIQRHLDFGESEAYLPNELVTHAQVQMEGELKDHAVILARLSLSLLDRLGAFIEPYAISQDKILGMIIHLLMAIERWYEHDDTQFEDANQIYEQLAIEHARLFLAMEQYFSEVERMLDVNIHVSERIAFFQYMV